MNQVADILEKFPYEAYRDNTEQDIKVLKDAESKIRMAESYLDHVYEEDYIILLRRYWPGYGPPRLNPEFHIPGSWRGLIHILKPQSPEDPPLNQQEKENIALELLKLRKKAREFILSEAGVQMTIEFPEKERI